MSRQELADAVNAYLFTRHGQRSGLDETYVGKLERGQYRWPNERYREAFRAVLKTPDDSRLGFYIVRAAPPQAAPPMSSVETILRRIDADLQLYGDTPSVIGGVDRAQSSVPQSARTVR